MLKPMASLGVVILRGDWASIGSAMEATLREANTRSSLIADGTIVSWKAFGWDGTYKVSNVSL
jgi:hypothetical protein